MRRLSIPIGHDEPASVTMDNADERVNLVCDSWLAQTEQAVATHNADPAVRGVTETTRLTQAVLRAHAIFATNIVTAPVTRLAPASARPGQSKVAPCGAQARFGRSHGLDGGKPT